MRAKLCTFQDLGDVLAEVSGRAVVITLRAPGFRRARAVEIHCVTPAAAARLLGSLDCPEIGALAATAAAAEIPA
ncbi:hypothetical protein [Roseovarius sp. C03]|uniref:hypothetical protein n=1 Tax=Roseovarius sp. C03 TaxID=3449222 RepID=UPI003EDC4653